MDSSGLSASIILLLSGVLAIGLSRVIHISPVVGFFAIGIGLGEHGFQLIDPKSQGIHILAELGVCFLLFDVGIHLSLAKLMSHWKSMVGLGMGQFLLTTALLSGAAILLGVPPGGAAIIGATLSLSSTAIVLKVLGDEGEMNSPSGRMATEVLVFQDLVAMILLVLVVGLYSGEKTVSAALVTTLVNVVIAGVFVGLAGRFLLRPFFAWIVAIKSDEVFTASALLFVLVTAWLTHSLGLSLALGAFLAGVALAESNFASLVRSEVAPFRALLLSLFFLSVGMSLDLSTMIANPLALVQIVALLIALKTFAMWVVARISGVPNGSALRLSFLLAQGSEFAFIVFASMQQLGLCEANHLAFLGGVVGASMAMTPIAAALGCFLSRCAVPKNHAESEPADVDKEVVLVEFDDSARQIASLLIEEGIPYRGHDRDWGRLSYAKSRGFEVYYSDPNRPRTLGRVSVGLVRALVCLVEDDEILRLLIPEVKKIAPNLPLFAATSDPRRLELLYSLGVTEAYLKRPESIQVLTKNLLHSLGYSDDALERLAERLSARSDRAMFTENDARDFPELAAAAAA